MQFPNVFRVSEVPIGLIEAATNNCFNVRFILCCLREIAVMGNYDDNFIFADF